jgi:hypothetical protein
LHAVLTSSAAEGREIRNTSWRAEVLIHRTPPTGCVVRELCRLVTYRFEVFLGLTILRHRRAVWAVCFVSAIGSMIAVDQRSGPDPRVGSNRAEVLGATQTSLRLPSTEPIATSIVSSDNLIGRLPDSAQRISAQPTTVAPGSVLAPLPIWRLASPVSYASGAIKAKPVPRSVQPIRKKSIVTAIATKLAAQQFGGSLRPSDIDTFFAEFDAPVGEWLGKVGSVETEPRSAWFVVFTGMESKRASGVVIRQSDQNSDHPPSTLSLDVTSDVVVVIDDDTGEVLVASEFLSEATVRSRS